MRGKQSMWCIVLQFTTCRNHAMWKCNEQEALLFSERCEENVTQWKVKSSFHWFASSSTPPMYLSFAPHVFVGLISLVNNFSCSLTLTMITHLLIIGISRPHYGLVWPSCVQVFHQQPINPEFFAEITCHREVKSLEDYVQLFWITSAWSATLMSPYWTHLRPASTKPEPMC